MQGHPGRAQGGGAGGETAPAPTLAAVQVTARGFQLGSGRRFWPRTYTGCGGGSRGGSTVAKREEIALVIDHSMGTGGCNEEPPPCCCSPGAATPGP
jgi:hypothetical protein